MRGVRRSKRHEGMVRLLAERAHPTAGNKSIFPTMRELVCFAAALGFESGRRRPLDKDVVEIDGRIFSNSQDAIDLLYLIALAESRAVSIFQDHREDEMLAMFEEYAEGGFEILQQWLDAKAEDVNGDQAILCGLFQNGYMKGEVDVEQAMGAVKF